MKKGLKITFAVLLTVLFLFFLSFLAFFVLTADAKLDEEKLENQERITLYYDKNNELLFKTSSGINTVNIEELPPYVYNSFVAVEDERFYSHNGVDAKSLFRALMTNIRTFSFKEGGSTISQQLIKNTQLNSDKTIKRKLSELKLALELEKKYKKSDILEKYINTIYFGNGCYGIADASEYYFGKKPENLSVSESAILASIIKSPLNYAPNKNPENCKKRRDIVLKKMLEQKYIDEFEYKSALDSEIQTKPYVKAAQNFFLRQAEKETENIIKNYPYEYKTLKVYTNFDKKIQEDVDLYFTSDKLDSDKTVCILDKENLVAAYASTIGERERRLGSTIKPVLVYAPAIETDTVFPCSIIKDEKTEIDGYQLKNYNDLYYGNVSVRFSLAKSLNSCAVKLLNSTGIENSKEYAVKCGINLGDNENNLSIALGNTENGTTLVDLLGAYSVFRDEGEYVKPSFIKEIIDDNGNVVYKKNNSKNRIFSVGTCELMNDMLNYTVKNGTAKALNSEIPLCAKTGTVGNEHGNTDAYTVSYNSEYVMGVWYGNADSSYMDNRITGGSYPARLAGSIWKRIYDQKPAPEFIDNKECVYLDLDREEYENGKVVLADENAPERYKIKEIFKKSKVPKERSDKFTAPKVLKAEISVDYSRVKIQLCLTKLANAYIYKTYNGKKELVFDTKNVPFGFSFIDRRIKPNTEYEYYVIPYLTSDKGIVTGETYYLQKIKSPALSSDDWWL